MYIYLLARLHTQNLYGYLLTYITQLQAGIHLMSAFLFV